MASSDERRPFEASRADGRSDRQVIFDVVHDKDPDELFTYTQLRTALLAGLPEGMDVTRQRVCQAVRTANKTLLKERNRYLRVVRNRGYRMITAQEHLPVAIDTKGRAHRLLRRGEELLKNVKWDELDENQRKLHEGQLMLMSGFVHILSNHDRRIRVMEGMFQRM